MTETYHGHIITVTPADAEQVRLCIVAPTGAADTVTVRGSAPAALQRARRTIDALNGYREGRCRCGNTTATCRSADGELLCPACAPTRV